MEYLISNKFRDRKGIGTVKTILAITALITSLIGISVALTLVNTLTDTTAKGSDSDDLTSLGDEVRELCRGLKEQGKSPEGKSIVYEPVKGETTKSENSLELNFDDGTAREITLPENCKISFAPDNNGRLDPGNYKLNLITDESASPPEISIEVDDS